MAIAVPHRTRGAIVSDYLISNQAGIKIKKLPLTVVAVATAVDTGFDLPARGVVLDAWIEVDTAESTGATKTIDLGLLASETGGDIDGFLDGVSVSAAGVIRGVPTITAGGSETYFASTTRGVLFASLTAGADSAGDVGTYFEKPHILNGTAKSVVYVQGSDDFVELVAHAWIMYIDLDGV